MPRQVLLLLLLSGALSCMGFTAAAALAHPARAQEPRPFRLPDLLEIISASGASGLEELLPLLPASLRESSVILHKSFSAQGATPMSPRVLLFDERGGLVLAFNGDASQRHHDTLELMTFDPIAARAEFLAIPLPFERDSRGRPRVRKPELCLACHGSDPRPIWKEFPGFEGAYPDGDGPARPDYERFERSASSHSRYRWVFPRLGPEERGILGKPNLRFGLAMARVNAMRASRLVRSSGAYPRFGRHLLFALLGCSWQGRDPATREEILSRIRGGLREQGREAEDPESPRAAAALLGLRRTDLEPRYIYPSRLSDELGPEDSHYDGSATQAELLAAEILRDLARQDPGLRPFYRPTGLSSAAGTPGASGRERAVRSWLDRMARWLPLPFPEAQLETKRRRAPAPGEREIGPLCSALFERMGASRP